MTLGTLENVFSQLKYERDKQYIGKIKRTRNK